MQSRKGSWGFGPTTKAMASPENKPAFPKQQMLVLALCRICEPIAFMSIFPYIYFMVQDFHVTEDKNRISFYAGMVTSAFTFAEFSTGVLWGRLSDKIGRKPVLLTGLVGTGLSVLLFGFAPNLTVALIARALGGFLNGNIGVLQTTVAELVTVKEHQPRAYSIMPLVWCIGSIVGPAIGGTLARPCESYPAMCGAGSIWERFPYLLPNLFSAVCVFCGVIIGVLFLEETHAVKKHERDRGVELGRWLLACFSQSQCNNLRGKSAEKQPLLDHDDELPSYLATECPAELTPSFPAEIRERASSDTSRPRDLKIRPAPDQKTFNRPVVLNIISYGILAFHTMTFDQLFPVFLSTDRRPPDAMVSLPFKFLGGFGLGTQTIGRILALQGLFSLASTTVLFPVVAKRLGALRLFQMLALSYFLIYLATPYLALLPESLQMTGIFAMLIWKCTFATLAYPSNAILLANSAPSNLQLGTINGIAASTASLCRAFGPSISGILYTLGLSSGYSGLAWWISGAVTLVGAAISLQITEPKGRLDRGSDEAGPNDVESCPPPTPQHLDE